MNAQYQFRIGPGQDHWVNSQTERINSLHPLKRVPASKGPYVFRFLRDDHGKVLANKLPIGMTL